MIVRGKTNRYSEDDDQLEMLIKKAMSLRGAAWAKALGATRQSLSHTGRTCIGYEIAALRSQ
jgi:hypothetical protein